MVLGRKEDDVEKKITSWLIEEGLRIAKLEKAPGLEVSWGYNVFTPPPTEVNIKVFQPKNFPSQIVLLMGVSFSKPHQEELARLSIDERIKFMSTLLVDLTKICPVCRIGVQPNIATPQAIIVTRILMKDEITKSLVLDEITRLVNCFLVVNASLWKRFPRTKSTEAQKQAPPTVM